MVEPAVTAVTKTWDIGVSALSTLFDRVDLVEYNKENLPEFLQMHDNALKEIEDLVKHALLHDIDSCNHNIKGRLREFRKKLENNRDKLHALENQIERAKFWKIWIRVRKIRTIMEECRTAVIDFRKYYDTSVRPALERTEEEKPTKTRTNRETAHQRTANATISDTDAYVAYRNVPPNPPRLTLDYSTEATYEGKLKAEILSSFQNSSRIVGVVAVGLGGVGKTCALRGLAGDPQVKETFPDGILYIQLGNDSKLTDVITGIANSVERTGGKRLSRTIRVMETVEEASEKAGKWFEGRSCLFLVDDVWEVNGITPDELRKLGSMLNDESLLVFTSRTKGFEAGLDKTVLFKERETHGELARNMLMSHANIGSYRDLNAVNRNAVNGILTICQGLPLALGIAGATVRRYSGSYGNNLDAWVNYYSDLESGAMSIANGSTRPYGALRRIVDRSLKVLDLESRFENTFEEMFHGFCVLQNQKSVSETVLQKLWNLHDSLTAIEIAELFESVSLVRIIRRGNKLTLQAHDLVLDIANEMASGNTKTEWFKTLLQSYRKDRNDPEMDEFNAGEEERITFSSWWEAPDDGFIHDNLCRVLRGAGESRELVWLLERAQWIIMRLQNSGICGVEQDLDIGIQVVEKGCTEQAKLVRYLRLIGSAARMSCVQVLENAHEAWFQMYGRVRWYAGQCERTRIFATDVGEFAPRPWAKPSVGVLNEAGGLMSESLRFGSCKEILDICHEKDVLRVLWKNLDMVGYVTEYTRTHGNRKTYKLGTTVADGEISGRRNVRSLSSVLCGAMSSNLKKLVTGYGDGGVVVWDIVSGYKVEHFLECPGTDLRRLLRWAGVSARKYGSESATCVAISGDGETVVCASEYQKVYVWKLGNPDAVGYALQTIQVNGKVEQLDVSFDGRRIVYINCNYWNIRAIHVWDGDIGRNLGVPTGMRDNGLRCVSISREGQRVLSGSMDGTIRVWNIGSVGRTVQSMSGHKDCVDNVAFSASGKRIISAAHDSTIRVWDAEKGTMIGHPLQMQTFERLADRPDKEMVLQVSNDTVSIFNMENMGISDLPLRCTESVQCVAYCGHGTKIITGSTDGVVRVWDAESGSKIGHLADHKGRVTCVAVSADGSRIVSGSADGSVRVCDANSGLVIPIPLSRVEETPFGIDSVAVNNDGTRVVFTFIRKVCVWDAQSSGVRIITRDARRYNCVAICADGALIAFLSRNLSEVIVWDLNRREKVRCSLAGQSRYIRSLTFSGDGTRLASGSREGVVKVWDVASGRALGYPIVHDYPVVHVQPDLHGLRVVLHDERGNGRMCDVTSGQHITTSSEAEWTPTLYRCGVAAFNWKLLSSGCRRITAHQQLLGTTDREIVRVGDLYFSIAHGNAFWPCSRVVR